MSLKRIPITLLLLGALLALALRVWPAANFNMGHNALVSYLFSDRSDEAALEKSYELLGTGRDVTVVRQADPWRLSYVSYLLGKYDEAVRTFDLATLAGTEDVLLTPNGDENQPSSEYWIVKALSSADTAPDDAVRSFRKGFTVEPREWDQELYRRYYDTLARSAEPGAQLAGQRLSSLLGSAVTAEMLDSWGTMTAVLPLNESQLVNRCWTLESLRYDGLALEQGPLVPVQLTWRRTGNKDAVPRDEALMVVNLAPNAGFEWDTDGEQIAGYPKTLYLEDDPAITHRLRQEARGEQPTSAAALENSAEHAKTSFMTWPIAVEPEGIYFQGGWMRSEAGRPSLGHRWPELRKELTQPHQYVGGRRPGQEWSYFGEELQMPARAEAAELLLANYNSDGTAVFDDILFFRLDPPSCN